jgi:hypothetical protein
LEAFEQFVALAMESEGLVVSGAVKFPVAIKTRKASREEIQVHGFEVDLVGARGDRLVLATVKSFFGSRGVVADQVSGSSATQSSLYALLNNEIVRNAVVAGAAKRFGFDESNVEVRLYVGKFAGSKNEADTREWCKTQIVGSGPIRVVGAHEVVDSVRKVAASRQYRDNAVLATIKVLEAAGALNK